MAGRRLTAPVTGHDSTEVTPFSWRGSRLSLIPRSCDQRPSTCTATSGQSDESLAPDGAAATSSRAHRAPVGSANNWPSASPPHGGSRHREPPAVGRYVMSATHSRLGAAARKSRLTRSGAGRVSGKRMVGRGPLRRLMPRISLATRLYPTWIPSSASRACRRGAP